MKKKAIKFGQLITSQEFQILPGNIAYSLCVSIVPIISIILYLLSSLNISSGAINKAILEVVPKAIIDFIKPVLTTDGSASQIFTLAFSIFVSTTGCNTTNIYNITASDGKGYAYLCMTLNQLVRRSGIPRPKVITLLARLVRFGVARWEYIDQQFLFSQR